MTITIGWRAIRAAFFAMLTVGAAQSQAATHKLTVAANPGLGVDNAEVDSVIAQMNVIIGRSTYGNPWDAPCQNVQFERSGDIIQDARLPTSGSYQDLVDSVHSVAPKADVLVVLGMTCAGVQGAAGCGAVGGEPMVVGTYKGFDDQLWLHERGHNVGLQHSGEGPGTDSTYPSNVGMRFMFWQLGVGHFGKLSSECSAFANSKLASVVPSKPKAGTQVATTTAAAPRPAASPASSPSASANVEKQLEEAARVTGLTPQAYRIVAPPWLHGLPVDALKTLNDEDLASVRKMLHGPVNQFWPQGITTLASVGREDDVSLINAALNLPLPAVAPTLSGDARDQIRSILRVKLTAPFALGILANRTHSSQATEILQRSAAMERATTLIGKENAPALSKEALHGLSIADTKQSREYLQAIVGGPGEVSASAIPLPTVAPLTKKEIDSLRANSKDVSVKGLEAYFKSKDGLTR